MSNNSAARAARKREERRHYALYVCIDCEAHCPKGGGWSPPMFDLRSPWRCNKHLAIAWTNHMRAQRKPVRWTPTRDGAALSHCGRYVIRRIGRLWEAFYRGTRECLITSPTKHVRETTSYDRCRQSLREAKAMCAAYDQHHLPP